MSKTRHSHFLVVPRLIIPFSQFLTIIKLSENPLYSIPQAQSPSKLHYFPQLSIPKFKQQRLQTMSRPQNAQQSENAQKDQLISSLKKQLYDLKDKQHEFIPLQNEVTNIQSRYDMLQEEKERIQNESKIKVEINRKSIFELRQEADNLKMQIHKATVNIDQVLRDITTIKRTCENRESQISSLLAANQDMNSKNDQLIEDNRAKVNKIKTLKEDRNKIDIDSEKYVKNLEDSISYLKTLEKEARALEASNQKLGGILQVAEKDHSELLQEMKNREEVVISTHRKLDALNLEIQTLRDKTKKLEKECQKSEEEYKATSDSLQALIGKNKQQVKRIKIFENQLRVIQNDLDRSILQRDALQSDHDMLSAQNQALNDQINSIFLQIAQYEKINSQLQEQIHNYIIIDQQARKMLDRRENMLNMVQSVTRKLGSTADNIAHLR